MNKWTAEVKIKYKEAVGLRKFLQKFPKPNRLLSPKPNFLPFYANYFPRSIALLTHKMLCKNTQYCQLPSLHQHLEKSVVKR